MLDLGPGAAVSKTGKPKEGEHGSLEAQLHTDRENTEPNSAKAAAAEKVAKAKQQLQKAKTPAERTKAQAMLDQVKSRETEQLFAIEAEQTATSKLHVQSPAQAVCVAPSPLLGTPAVDMSPPGGALRASRVAEHMLRERVAELEAELRSPSRESTMSTARQGKLIVFGGALGSTALAEVERALEWLEQHAINAEVRHPCMFILVMLRCLHRGCGKKQRQKLL